MMVVVIYVCRKKINRRHHLINSGMIAKISFFVNFSLIYIFEFGKISHHPRGPLKKRKQNHLTWTRGGGVMFLGRSEKGGGG